MAFLKDQVLLEQKYNLVREAEQANSPVHIKTFGDLSKLIKDIQIRSKSKAALSTAANFAIDQILGLIPGASNAKTAFEFFKAITSKPDTKKTNTVLDRLDVDDEVSKIVDDTVEAAFIQHLQEIISKHDQNLPIPQDWNMTKELYQFLKTSYHGRSIEVPH